MKSIISFIFILLVVFQKEMTASARAVYKDPNGKDIIARIMNRKDEIVTNLSSFLRGLYSHQKVEVKSLKWTSQYGNVVSTA